MENCLPTEHLKGAVTLWNVSCNLSRNVLAILWRDKLHETFHSVTYPATAKIVARQVARKVELNCTFGNGSQCNSALRVLGSSFNVCRCIPDRIGICQCWFFSGEGKTGVPREKPLGARTTTNSTHIWRRDRESNPGHIGGRRVLSPLRHPCTPLTTAPPLTRSVPSELKSLKVVIVLHFINFASLPVKLAERHTHVVRRDLRLIVLIPEDLKV